MNHYTYIFTLFTFLISSCNYSNFNEKTNGKATPKFQGKIRKRELKKTVLKNNSGTTLFKKCKNKDKSYKNLLKRKVCSNKRETQKRKIECRKVKLSKTTCSKKNTMNLNNVPPRKVNQQPQIPTLKTQNISSSGCKTDCKTKSKQIICNQNVNANESNKDDSEENVCINTIAKEKKKYTHKEIMGKIKKIGCQIKLLKDVRKKCDEEIYLKEKQYLIQEIKELKIIFSLNFLPILGLSLVILGLIFALISSIGIIPEAVLGITGISLVLSHVISSNGYLASKWARIKNKLKNLKKTNNIIDPPEDLENFALDGKD